MFIESGTLPIGVDIDGEKRRAFTLRPATLGDNVDALEEVGPGASSFRLSIAILARQISFDGVAQEKVDTALLLGLLEPDYQIIEQARTKLEKKLETLSGS